MTVIDRKPAPIYEIECYECHSIIHYKKKEVISGYINCPVCGIGIAVVSSRPVTYENEEISVDDPIVYRGDEIEALDTGSKVRFIAWYVYDGEIHGIDEDGGDYIYPLDICRKTGKHYDIIFKPVLSDSEVDKEKIKQSLNVDPLCC